MSGCGNASVRRGAPGPGARRQPPPSSMRMPTNPDDSRNTARALKVVDIPVGGVPSQQYGRSMGSGRGSCASPRRSAP